MIVLPVRVELQVGVHSGGPACSLTIPSINFPVTPSSGDFVLFTRSTEEPFAIPVNGIAHYDDGVSLVLLRPVPCEDYDDMLTQLDWFKSRYEIQDFTAEDSPEPYYVLYRTVIHLLKIEGDAPVVLYDPDLVKVLAETCRTVWLATMCDADDKLPTREWVFEQVSDTNIMIKLFHQIVFDYKLQFPKGVELRRVIKDWDAKVNDSRLINWDVDDDLCSFIGRAIFSRLKCDKPAFLRTD